MGNKKILLLGFCIFLMLLVSPLLLGESEIEVGQLFEDDFVDFSDIFEKEETISKVHFLTKDTEVEIIGELIPHYKMENNQKVLDEDGNPILEGCIILSKTKIKISRGEKEKVYDINISGGEVWFDESDNSIYGMFQEDVDNFLGYTFYQFTSFLYDFDENVITVYPDGLVQKYGITISPVESIAIKGNSIEISDAYIIDGDKISHISVKSLVILKPGQISIFPEYKNKNLIGKIRNGNKDFTFADNKVYYRTAESHSNALDLDIQYGDLKLQNAEDLFSNKIELACPITFSTETEITGAQIIPFVPSVCRVVVDSKSNVYSTVKNIDWSKKKTYESGDYFILGTQGYEEVTAIQTIIGANVDGKYGDATFNAVLNWQKEYNKLNNLKWPKDQANGALNEDGLWGPETTKAYLTSGFNVVVASFSKKKEIYSVDKELPKEKTRKPREIKNSIKVKEIYIVSGKENSVEFNNINKEPKDTGPYEKVYLFAVIEDKDNNFYVDSRLKNKKIMINNKYIKIKNDLSWLKRNGLELQWYKIYPELHHKNYLERQGKTEESCPLDPSPLLGQILTNYCWYQNVKKSDFFTNKLDTLHYIQKLISRKSFIKNDKIGVTRYRVELINNGEIVASTPGKPANTLSGLEDQAYNFRGGGISNKVHKIVRRSDFSQRIGKEDCEGNNFGCSFIEYLEAQYGTVWIFGSTFYEADNEIGVECSHFPRAALRDMGYIKIGYATAQNLFTYYTLPRINGKYLLPRINGKISSLQLKKALWADKNGEEIKIPVGNKENEIHIGDLIFFGEPGKESVSHTTIFFADTGFEPGYLDAQDLVIDIGHEMGSPQWLPRVLVSKTLYALVRARRSVTKIPDTWIAQGYIPNIDKSMIYSHGVRPRFLGTSNNFFIIRKIDQTKI